MKLVEKMALKFDKLSDSEKQENLNMARYLLSLMYHGLEKAIFDGNGIMMSSRDKDGEVKFFMISAYEVKGITPDEKEENDKKFDKDLKELHEDGFDKEEEKIIDQFNELGHKQLVNVKEFHEGEFEEKEEK